MTPNDYSTLKDRLSREHHRWDGFDGGKGLLRGVSEAVSRNEITNGDKIYEECIDSVGQAFANSTMDASKILHNTAKHPISKEFRLCLLLSSLSENFIMGWDDFQRDKRRLDEFEDEFFDKPAYQYFRSRIYYNGYTKEHEKESLKSAHRATNQISDNTNVYIQFAASVAQQYSPENDEVIDIDGKTISQDELWEKAIQYAQLAIRMDEDNIQYRLTLAKVYESSRDYNNAREVYENVTEMTHERSLWPEHQSPVEEDKDVNELLQNLKQKENQLQIEEQIEQASDSIAELEADLEQSEKEIRQASERYREQALQFIGFFAAIVAVILGSIQIATSFTSFAEAGGLLLIFIGGLILSFGGFSISLRHHHSDGLNWKSLILPLVGMVLMTIGFVIPYLNIYQ